MGYEAGKGGRNKGRGPDDEGNFSSQNSPSRYRRPSQKPPKKSPDVPSHEPVENPKIDATKQVDTVISSSETYSPPELTRADMKGLKRKQLGPTWDEEFAQKDDPEIEIAPEAESSDTFSSFEEIGFTPQPLSPEGREWILDIPMERVRNTKAIPIDIENAFREAGFEAEIDNEGTEKSITISASGQDGDLYEATLTHQAAVEYLKDLARAQADADVSYRAAKNAAMAVPKSEEAQTEAMPSANLSSGEPIVTDNNVRPLISSYEAALRRYPNTAPEKKTIKNPELSETKDIPDIDTSRTRNPFYDERRVRAAEAELGGHDSKLDTTKEGDAAQSNNPSENIPTPVDADVARQQLDAELAGGVSEAATATPAEEATATSTESAPQSASAEKSRNGENINAVNDQADTKNKTAETGSKNTLIVEDFGIQPLRGPRPAAEPIEDINFKEATAPQRTAEPQPTVAETAAPASAESTPQPTAAEAAATSTESAPQPAVPENGADTEEQINSLEARVKALQEAYQNGSYETPEFNQQFPEFAAALAAAGGEKKAAMGLLLTQYYKLNQQLVEQRRKERHEKVAKIGKRFEAEFKITPEQLASIEGIEKLSEAQQKLLFENFTQLTLGNVREEAAALTANLSAEQRAAAVGTYGKALGNAFASIREVFTKSKNALANEKAAAKQVREGGFAEHKELLTQLAEGMVENGPQVTEEKGELVIDLVNLSPEERGPDGGEVARAAALLSRESNALARIPAADRATIGVDDIGEKPGLGARFGRWLSTDKAQRARQEQVQNAAAAYESAKLGLTEALRKQGMSDIQIAQRLLEVDIRVSQQQTVMTDPDAIKALSEIENKSFWKETAKSFAKGNGLYFGLGFVGRTALGATGGVFALPLVAAGVASLRSWDSSAALLRERDRNQRAGVKDGEAGALNVVAADSLIEKTELLIKRFNNPEATPEDKQKLLNSLRVRTEYIQDKMLLGRVSYGTKVEAVRAQTELAKKLGEAMALLAAEEQNFRAAMSTRYERLTGKLDTTLERTENKIRDERGEYRMNQLTQNAAKASAFAVAGIALGALAEEAGVGNKMSQYIEDAKKRASAWWGATPMGKTTNGLDELSQLEGRGGSAPAAQVPAPESTPTQPPPTPEGGTSTYTIQRGDTLTKILKEQALGGQTSPTPAQLARFFNSLTTVELQSLGVRSQNPDLIFAGETINTEKLKALWEAKAETVNSAPSATSATTGADEAYTRKLNREAEIRTTVEPIPSGGEEIPARESLNDINQLIPKATNGEEVTRVAQESVAADLETKVRAQAIHKQLLSAAGIGNLEWDALSSKKMIDVMNAVAQSDSKDWFEMLFNSPRDGWSPLGAGTNLDLKKLQEMVKLASSESIGIKASPGESVEHFMRRLTTKLAEASKLGTLPPGFNGVSGAAQ